ncbi:MAG: ABC transporter ATP-binding protein [Bauldia sp.]|uniref:ABC transporter ATP-binding protein n=1 Tax=Bauldia sp. TaxID=2575872 RepID=UPI001E01F363|nr:ABC transporter ATP-binding protein [Bauldia sp.]MCB1497005.1 ABC transporter ATP-binding protein [Bauldia sp.]
MTRVELRGLRKDFGRVTVVPDLDLTIDAGEFVALVGPSGCGKSTVLRMVAGLEPVTRGSITFDGRDVSYSDPKERNVAMVFQSYALYPHMTVAKNMSFNLELAGRTADEIERAVQNAASLLRLEDLLDRKPNQLSGGQRQRVAMGRAMVRNPALFLFDEPLSNLDAQLRVKMRSEIKLLHRKLNITTIYVTHDQIEAMTLADKIVVLNDGRIEQVGRPMELYARPANRFVAEFIGSPAMNMIPASLCDRKLVFSGGEMGYAYPPEERQQEVILGLRPEHLSLSDQPTGITGNVTLVEPTGAQTSLLLDVGGSSVVAVLDGTVTAEVDREVFLAIDPANVHLFDPRDGKRLPQECVF